MNKVYKVIWNKVRGCYVVVSELAKNHSRSKSSVTSSRGSLKSALALGVLLCVAGMAQVAPVSAYEAAGGTTTDDSSIAIGEGASSNRANSIAIGKGAKNLTATPEYAGASIAIGENSVSNGHNSIAFGRLANSVAYSIAMGYKAKTTAQNAIAIGNGTEAANQSVALGNNAKVSGRDSIGIGAGSNVISAGSIGIGSSGVSGGFSIGIGSTNSVRGGYSGAIGRENTIFGGTNANSFAVGNHNVIGLSTDTSVGKYTYVLGSDVVTSANYSVALGYNSKLTEDYVVSVGSDTKKRKIVYVADGVADSDAATFGQLKAEQEARSAADAALQANIDAEKTARESAITDVTNTLNSKVADLTAKDTELEGAISTEKNERENAITGVTNELNTKASALQANIDAEKTARESAITDVTNTLNSKVADLTAKDTELEGKLTNEATARENAVISLRGDLNTKTAALQTSIDAEVTAREVAVSAEKTARESAISDLNSTLNTKASALQANIDAEKTAREGAITDVTNTLNSKVADLTAKDSALEGVISTEKTTRESEISRLDTRINNINTNIGNIEQVVSYDSDGTKRKLTLAGINGTVIANVKAGEVSADSMQAVNGSQLYKEQQDRIAANTELQNSLTTSVGVLSAKDTELEGAISAEKNERENAITGVTNELNTKASALQANIDAEKTARESAITDVTNTLNSKVADLTAKDTELEGKITTAETTLGSRINALNNSLSGLTDSALTYDAGSEKGKLTLAGINGTVIANVKAGAIGADSTEAVNGGQLYTEQEARNAKDAELQTAIDTEVNDRVNAVNVLRTEVTGMLDGMAAYTDSSKGKIVFGGAGGTLLTNLRNGTVAADSTDAVTGSQLFGEAKAREDADNALSERIDNINSSVSDIKANGVSYDDADKGKLTLKGANGTVINNVADGKIAAGSMEAVNGGQLYDEAKAREDADNALSERIDNINSSVSDIKASGVSYDDADKGKITFKGEDGTVLGNVGVGSVAEGSMEAVNGGQLHETNTKLDNLQNKVGSVQDGTYVHESASVGENVNALDNAVAANASAIDELGGRMSSSLNFLGRKVNNTGAHAAALAALHPVLDDDSKFGFSAGIGSYHNSKAAAIGLFYRPADRYQFSLGGTTGYGEHMYNIGFSVALDKNVNGPLGSKKAMVREIVQLREERDNQSKQIADLQSSIAVQNKKIEELTKLVTSITGAQK